MEETTKITTKTYYVCIACERKMESVNLGNGSDFMGLLSASQKAMYCDNKKCDKFGFLTVAGFRREE